MLLITSYIYLTFYITYVIMNIHTIFVFIPVADYSRPSRI